MTILLTILSIELGLVFLALLLLVIYLISVRHPQGFAIVRPVDVLNRIKGIGITLVSNNSFTSKLRADLALIYKKVEPEVLTSVDGNTLYLSTKLSSDWTKEQIVLFMLATKKEFLQQIEAKDPAVFEAITVLTDKVSLAKIQVQFSHMNFLPTFSKDMLVWKLPLIDQPVVRQAIHDIVVKELQLS